MTSEALPKAGAPAGVSAGGPTMQQLLGTVELRLSKQLSDIDRRLQILAVDLGGGIEHLNSSLQKAQVAHPHTAVPPQQPTPAVPPSSAPSLGMAEAMEAQLPLASWIAAHCAERNNTGSCAGTPFGARDDADASTLDHPIFFRSRTGSVTAPTESSLPSACLMKRNTTCASLESNLSPISQIMRKVRPSSWAQVTWTFLEDPDSSSSAMWYSYIWPAVIAVSVMVNVLEMTEPPALSGLLPRVVDLCFDVIFLLEALLRYSVCPSSCVFVRNPQNMIDVLAALPLFVRSPCLAEQFSCDTDTWASAVLYNLFPTLRLLKTLRHFKQFHLFLKLLKETREALSVLLFTLCIIVLAFSSLIYLVEPRENIASLPKAMYMVIVTISTVGYGDVTPESNTGSVVIALTIVCSVLYMAMPIGIIGNAFTQIWSDRDRILLTVRTRERFAQWGYTAKDMQMLFQHFDRNNNGELTLPEFRKMIAEMRIGIQDQDERVVQLFESFDRDGSGGIDEKEFTRVLFPSAYHEIYGTPRPKAQPQEAADPGRFLRMNLPIPGRHGRRTDSSRSNLGPTQEAPPAVTEAAVTEAAEEVGSSHPAAAEGDRKHLLMPGCASFHSARSNKPKNSRGNSKEARSVVMPSSGAASKEKAKDEKETPGVLMDVPPLFAVCC